MKTYGSIRDYCEAVPAAKTSGEVDFGVHWKDDGGGVYRVSWVRDTGEVYAVRIGRGIGPRGLHRPSFVEPRAAWGPEGVVILGVVPSRERLEEALEGWADRCMTGRASLDWALERVAVASASEGFRDWAKKRGSLPADDDRLDAAGREIGEALVEAVEAVRPDADETAAVEAMIENLEGGLERKDRTLSFFDLRVANLARLPHFKNPKGESAHDAPDGSDWTLGEWSNAVLGELGEAANLIKKVRRGDVTLDEARPALAREFADVVTYLDLLAFRAGIDLGNATREKWNEVAERIGYGGRL